MVIVHEMFHWCRLDFPFPLLPASFSSISVSMLQTLWVDYLDDRHDSICTMPPSSGKCYRPNAQRLGFWEFGNGPYDNIQRPFAGDTMGYYSPFTGLTSQANMGTVFDDPNLFGNTFSNPTRLVWNFEQQVDSDAKYKMMGNVDNFVCWIWNRWIDHGYCRLNYFAPATP